MFHLIVSEILLGFVEVAFISSNLLYTSSIDVFFELEVEVMLLGIFLEYFLE